MRLLGVVFQVHPYAWFIAKAFFYLEHAARERVKPCVRGCLISVCAHLDPCSRPVESNPGPGLSRQPRALVRSYEASPWQVYDHAQSCTD